MEVIEPDGEVRVHPDISSRDVEVELEYVNTVLNLQLTTEDVSRCLDKMGLVTKASTDSTVTLEVPVVRSDILHPCDIVEDIGIAYGYNNLPREVPKTNTIGGPQPLNKFTDLLRGEFA